MRPTSLRVDAIVCGAALALSALFFLAFAWVALARVSYPFDLEWMEGAQLTHSRELLAGRSIYRAPSSEFIAFGYQPLYAVVVAALGALFGLTPAIGRAVSIASTLVLAWLLARIVTNETKSAPFGVLAAGLCFASYPVTGFWFDLVRVDSLFLALLVGGLYVARYATWRHAWIAAGALLFAAYKTKQLALPFVFLPVPLLARKDRRRAAIYAATSALFLVGDRLVGDALTHGWYSFFVAKVPTGQPYQWRRLTSSFWVRALVQMPVVVLAAAVDGARALKRRPWMDLLSETWLLAAALGVAATLAAWARPGGASNNFQTTYLLAIPPALRELHRWTIDSPANARAPARAAAFALVLAQLALLAYDPREQIPTAADTAEARAFIERLARVPGPVLVPEHPWYAVLAGKEPSYHSCALWELRKTTGQDAWPADLRARLAAGDYALVVTAWPPADPDLGSYPPELATTYRAVDALSFDGHALESYSGKSRTRPAFVFAPVTDR